MLRVQTLTISVYHCRKGDYALERIIPRLSGLVAVYIIATVSLVDIDRTLAGVIRRFKARDSETS